MTHSSVVRQDRMPDHAPLSIGLWPRISTAAGGSVKWILLLALVLIIIPSLAVLFYVSVRTGSPGAPNTAFTLRSWESLLSGPGLAAIGNTFIVSALTVVFAVPIGFLFAWFEVQTNAPGRGLMAKFLVIPLVFSPLLTTLAWIVLAAPRSGVINILARQYLGIDVLFNVYTLYGMVFVATLYFVPVAYMNIRSSLSAIDGTIFEAGRVAGCRPPALLLHILVPMIAPALVSASLVVFSMSVSTVAVVTLLGATARIETLQALLFTSVIGTPADLPRASSIATLLLLVSIAGVYINRWFLRRPSRFTSVTGRGFKPMRFDLGRWGIVATFAMLSFVMLSSILPYLALAYGAFTPFITSRIDLTRLSLQNFREFADNPLMMQGVTNTLIVVMIGALVTTMISAIIAYYTRRHRDGLAHALEFVSFLPLALPHLSFALGLLFFVLSVPFLRDNLYGTLLLMYIAQAVTFLPLGVQIVSSGVLQIGKELEDAARIAGAPVGARTLRILVPLLGPTLASAWTILALYALVEAGTGLFLYTAGSVTTAVNVFIRAMGGEPALMYAGAFGLATFGLIILTVGNYFFGFSRHLGGGMNK